MSYEALTEYRDVTLEGVTGWWWVKGDTGAWDGPSTDFPQQRDGILPHLKSKRVMVQAGGCCGMYPRLWSKHFETVITFEPDPLSFYCLTRNCQDDKIVKINAALGYDRGMLEMERCSGNVGMNRALPSKVGRIPTLRIDDLGLEVCDFICLDMEGLETGAVTGAMETIRRCRPVISSELSTIESVITPLGYMKVGQFVSDHVYVPLA